VGAQGVLDQVFARLDRFVGPDRHLDDDASLVVLKVRDEVMLPSLPH
jgi:sigma-B regulation protein RsbU (phosphoserine phosphatase)